MAEAAKRVSIATTLKIGGVKVPIGLFSTVADPGKLAKFDTAGPNGGVLQARQLARPTPVDEVTEAPAQPVRSDPLADDPGSDVPLDVTAGTPARASSPVAMPGDVVAVAGEYARALVEDGSGAIVMPDEVRRGVRLEDGAFIDCTERLAQIDERTRLEAAEVVGFIDSTQIPRVRVKGAYYVGAMDDPMAPVALRLLWEGLRTRRRGAVVKLTKRSRQSLGLITQFHDTLVLLELVWSEDFRPAPARAMSIQAAQVTQGQVDTMLALIDAMSEPPSVVDTLRDDAIALREELKTQALAGELDVEIVDAEVVDPADEVLAQLEASLAAVS